MHFGKYELLTKLRVGGMAEVFLAHESAQPVRAVAVKRILPSFTDEADYVAMFLDEARLSLRLKHEGIAEVFELGCIDDAHYIALEYVHGQDLSALLRRARDREQPLPVPVACKIVLDVCRALQYAHSLGDERGAPLGIVHRDVSPQNVLISYAGDVKLIDFGIAKSSEQLMRTQAGLLKGKHGYLSPEQAQGKEVDRRSDLFSLGICLYEMLAAERLFLGSSDFSTVVKVRKAEVPRLSSRNHAVPTELEAIVARALARDRMDRFQSAGEMAEALTRFIEQSGERCERERLGQYMREQFADEWKSAPTESSEGARDPGTGLLDAFDDIEPVSTVSQLASIPDYADEPSQVLGATPVAPGDEGRDDSEAKPQAQAEVGVGKIAGAGLEAHGTEPAATDEPGLVTQTAPILQSLADVAPEPDTLRPPVAAPAKKDDSTRIVAYQSTVDGYVDEAIPEQMAMQDARHPELRHARAATLPGVGMGWDDEELSTQIYDAPEPGPGSAPAWTQERPRSNPAFAPESVSSGTSTPPSQARPSMPRGASVRAVAGSLPPHAPSSVPSGISSPSGTGRAAPPAGLAPRSYPAPPSSVAPPPPRPSQEPARGDVVRSASPYLAVIIAVVAILAVIVGGILFFREPARGAIHLTTQPVDATVTFDGLPASGSASPFILSNVTSGVMHVLEVSKPGFRNWTTQITLRPNEVMDLPVVQLASLAPPSEAAPVAQRSEAVAAAAAQPVPAAVAQPVPAPTSVPVAATRPATFTTVPSVIKPKAGPRTRAQGPTAADTSPAAPRAESAEGAGTGTLRINSRPWSVVYVDGRLVGNTPQMAVVLGAGTHTVTLANKEFGLQKTITVELGQGQVVTKIVDLQ